MWAFAKSICQIKWSTHATSSETQGQSLGAREVKTANFYRFFSYFPSHPLIVNVKNKIFYRATLNFWKIKMALNFEHRVHFPYFSIFSHLSSGLSETRSRSVLDLDVSSSGNPLELSSWGLPPEVLRKYNELGITHMFEWQAECLRTGKVLTGGKMVHLNVIKP